MFGFCPVVQRDFSKSTDLGYISIFSRSGFEVSSYFASDGLAWIESFCRFT